MARPKCDTPLVYKYIYIYIYICCDTRWISQGKNMEIKSRHFKKYNRVICKVKTNTALEPLSFVITQGEIQKKPAKKKVHLHSSGGG